MATATIGHMDNFDQSLEDIEAYLERVELFFDANETKNKDKVAILY